MFVAATPISSCEFDKKVISFESYSWDRWHEAILFLWRTRRCAMSFYQEMRDFVLRHGAINNPYLDRFQTGALTDPEFRTFAVEFYNFARFFPRILVAQLVNTEDETVADELTKVLYSELGDGRTKNRHELLYRDFLRSLGIDVHESMTRPMLPSTRAYIDGMEQLYSSGNHAMALGASFGLENMAITMWDHIVIADRKSTRLNSSHGYISYAVFCLKKKK